MNEQSIITNASSNTNGNAVLETDRQFFDALIQSDVETLGQILSDDFIIIDVMKGAETTKAEIIGAIGSGIVRFEKIELRDNRVRLYHRTAVITGQTRMTVRFSEILSSISSRYTHVYCELDGKWRLVSAQGTSIQQQ
ncbi:MAG TPA: nuclear transport factor 2 family protein [Terriglobia bacterium]|nr:nuclear transport factor 2 family protein [Terriglobia bacterium]